MSKTIDTVPIIYAGGNYGTFVEWCLNYFSGQIQDKLPFTDTGNSHLFLGNHLTDKGWSAYLLSNTYHKLVRFYPKHKQEDNFIDQLNEILSSVSHAILLYPDIDSFLLSINNKFEKIYDNGWVQYNNKDLLEFISNWGIKDILEMQPWELREFLSLYIWQQHYSEVELDLVKSFLNPKLIKVELRDLTNDFEKTITKLLNICNFPIVRNNFSEIHQIWLSKQKHIHKDSVVKNIVESVISDNFYDWSNVQLTLVDEAIIQMRLRDLHGLDLLCYNLNEFPTNTTDLRKLLIDAKSI